MPGEPKEERDAAVYEHARGLVAFVADPTDWAHIRERDHKVEQVYLALMKNKRGAAPAPAASDEELRGLAKYHAAVLSNRLTPQEFEGHLLGAFRSLRSETQAACARECDKEQKACEERRLRARDDGGRAFDDGASRGAEWSGRAIRRLWREPQTGTPEENAARRD